MKNIQLLTSMFLQLAVSYNKAHHLWEEKEPPLKFLVVTPVPIAHFLTSHEEEARRNLH